MRSTRSSPASARITLGLILVFGFLVAVPGRATATRAIVLTDLGDAESTIPAMMQALGWQVTTAKYLELRGPKAEAVAAADVFWVTATTKNSLLESLVRTGGVLDVFARGGGVVVVTGVNPVLGVNAGPGGVKAMQHPEDGGGAVAITDATHPTITGEGIEGVAVTAQTLCPNGAGAGCCILMPAAIQDAASVIASNEHGPVIIDYPLDGGRVVLSSVPLGGPEYTSNLLLYLQSLRP